MAIRTVQHANVGKKFFITFVTQCIWEVYLSEE